MSAPFGDAASAAEICARPDSVPVGVLEHRVWKPLGELALQLCPGTARRRSATKDDGWRFKDAVLAAAKQYDHEGKMPGDRWGPLGPNGLKVLETLFQLIDFATGRIDPTIQTITEGAKVARATVVSALKRLRKGGFLTWVRRKVELDNDGPGPQIHQTSNAYWFKLRGRAEGLVRLWLAKRRPPPPADIEQHRQQARQETEAMLERATSEDVARFRAGDSPLGDALAGLGRAFDSSANSMIGRNPDR